MSPLIYYGLGTVFVFLGLVFFSVGSILSGGLSFLIGIYIVNRGVVVSRDRYEGARKFAEAEKETAKKRTGETASGLKPQSGNPEKSKSEKEIKDENS